MGGLISKPKVKTPAAPAPAPAVTSPPAPAADSGSGSSPTASSSDGSSTTAPTANAAATQSLLQRDRGLFGTVLTGFRGLLAPAYDNSQRKTLLGE